ncbi:type II toxin-antitoxin system HigB family toxin [Pandoraea sputorum]|uniref:type II toxin-antitoxin system HigB family toxin n=1 Tax=Pandoraea sputorum TaxID=93222 RepID=UPI002AF6C656|nr:type II toxin-antitoxin system HigB family toxin [Pandoraea sputorum]
MIDEFEFMERRGMRVISKARLREFWLSRPDAQDVLTAWYRLASTCRAENFSELKQWFGGADYVPPRFTVFNVGGNKFRIVACLPYDQQKLYIRGVFSHREYDAWSKGNRRS